MNTSRLNTHRCVELQTSVNPPSFSLSPARFSAVLAAPCRAALLGGAFHGSLVPARPKPQWRQARDGGGAKCTGTAADTSPPGGQTGLHSKREREKEPRCYIEMKWPDEGGRRGVVWPGPWQSSCGSHLGSVSELWDSHPSHTTAVEVHA